MTEFMAGPKPVFLSGFFSSFSAAVKIRFFLIFTARLQGAVTLNSLTGKLSDAAEKNKNLFAVPLHL